MKTRVEHVVLLADLAGTAVFAVEGAIIARRLGVTAGRNDLRCATPGFGELGLATAESHGLKQRPASPNEYTRDNSLSPE